MSAQVTVLDVAQKTGSGADRVAGFKQSGVGRETGVAGLVPVMGGSK
jgi:hypothetical protein